jgi:hypothetical protein
MFAALLSIMERSGLTTVASRPAIVSSFFLSSNGKPLAIVIVVLATAIVVGGAGLDGLGDGVGVTVTAAGASEYNSSVLSKHNNTGIIVLKSATDGTGNPPRQYFSLYYDGNPVVFNIISLILVHISQCLGQLSWMHTDIVQLQLKHHNFLGVKESMRYQVRSCLS